MTVREKAFGQDYKLSFIDNLGISMSAARVKKEIKKLDRQVSCLEIGCGYYAKLLCGLLPHIKEGIGVDISIFEGVKNIEKLKFIQSPIETAFELLKGKSFDLIIMVSVLEHLNNPLQTLENIYNHLNENGVLLINVPTWLGKCFLEFSAFKLGLSPKSEMDDHKMYYEKKDLWPLLVKAGFKPSKIKLEYHKCGLNLFCTIIK